MIRRIRRLAASFMLFQYVAAVFAIPVLHAAFSDDQPVRAAHFEQLGNKNCQPVHNHNNCAAFSGPRLLGSPATVARIPDGSDTVAAGRMLETEGQPRAAAVSSLGSRAPPVA